MDTPEPGSPGPWTIDADTIKDGFGHVVCVWQLPGRDPQPWHRLDAEFIVASRNNLNNPHRTDTPTTAPPTARLAVDLSASSGPGHIHHVMSQRNYDPATMAPGCVIAGEDGEATESLLVRAARFAVSPLLGDCIHLFMERLPDSPR